MRHAQRQDGTIETVSRFGSTAAPSVQGIGLYVHVPFCLRKCRYCDFYSVPATPAWIARYAQAVCAELRWHAPCRPAATVYIGGGTPTVLPIPALTSVLCALAPITARDAEFTVEANPASADEAKLQILRRYGVNRLSLGAQSFHADDLAFLGRMHGPSDIMQSVATARRAGFENISLDLIYALPRQTVDGWRDCLRRAVDLGVEHLSCYALTYEPGTPLARLRDQGRIRPCDESLEADLFEMSIDALAGAGYEHYEISNFARPGMRCRANVGYWENREYLGFGPSAVSYLAGVRSKNVADVQAYAAWMEQDPASVVVEREQLTPIPRACETAIQMLRLTEGIRPDLFQRLTGFDPHELFAEPIERFVASGLLIATPKRICLTRPGLLLANRVMVEFLLNDSTERAGDGFEQS